MMFSNEGRRRRYARLKASYVANCAKMRADSLPAGERRLAEAAETRTGGFIFETGKAFSVGDIVRLDLSIPGWGDFLQRLRLKAGHEGDRISVIGKIVLVELLTEDRYEAGVCFANIDSGRRELLLRHLIAGMHSALSPKQP